MTVRIELKRRLKRLIRTTFEDGFEQEIRYLGEGADAVVFSVGEKFCVKFPKHETAVKKIRNEVKILRFLEGKLLPFSVPKYFRTVETGDKKYPFYTVISKIKGTELTRKRFDKMTEETKERAVNDISAFLSALHGLDASGAGITEVRFPRQFETDYELLKRDFYPKFRLELRCALDGFFQNVFAFYDKHPVRYALAHGDLSIDVFYFDDAVGRITGIIDFGDGRLTDADADFIYLMEGEEDYPLSFGQRVHTLYGKSSEEAVFRKIRIDHAYWDFVLLLRAVRRGDEKAVNRSLKKINSPKKPTELNRVFETLL